MKIGMNLVLWTLAVRTEQFGLLRSLRLLGYEGVEIPITPGNGEGFGEIRRVLGGEGLQCTTLTNLRPDANPVSADRRVRQKGIDGLRWATDVSERLGSTILSGPFYAGSDVSTGAGPTRVELDRVGASDIGLVYDTHHAHLEEDIHQALTAAGGWIRHAHFSESHRGTLGGGLLDWSGTVRALKAIGYDGWLMVEAFSTDVAELAQKAKVWRNTFNSRDQVAWDGIAFVRRVWA